LCQNCLDGNTSGNFNPLFEPTCEECGGAFCKECKDEYEDRCNTCQEEYEENVCDCCGYIHHAESFSADARELYRTDPKELLKLARNEGLECSYCGGYDFHEPFAMPYSKAVGGATIYYPCSCGETQVVITDKRWGAESHAYSYAYNEGHSDSRKTGEYRPSLSGPKQEGDFKRILKQKAEEDEEFIHTKQFLCGLEGHKWKMKPLKKTCKKCGFVMKNRLRGHR
jgi:hypothetical protein